MILDLREFETFPVYTRLEEKEPQFDFAGTGVLRLESYGVDLAIQKSNEEYFCQAEVEGEAIIECVRCLREFSQALENETDFIICSYDSRINDRDVIDDEDYAYFQGTDLRVDISELMRQALILALSMKPLCSPDCLGLCPTCGINLNESRCNCRQQVIDSRWEGLKKFKKSS